MNPRRSLATVRRVLAGALAAVLVALPGCRTAPPLATVPAVDLDRYMGDWYVVASIPAPLERNSYNGIESYRLAPDGTILTTYTFRDGGFDGPARRYTPNARVRNVKTHAEWGMQFVWPLRSEYLITYLADDYSAAIVARSARDYAWILSRTPDPAPGAMDDLIARLGRQGYDTQRVRRVPQRW